MAHHPSTHDGIETKIINNTTDPAVKYACWKCLDTNRQTIVECRAGQSVFVKDRNHRKDSRTKRHKSIKHYMGMKLCVSGHVVGFLNIEFHNEKVFADDDEMYDYIGDNLVVFKSLLEYQFLKRVFFDRVSRGSA